MQRNSQTTNTTRRWTLAGLAAASVALAGAAMSWHGHAAAHGPGGFGGRHGGWEQMDPETRDKRIEAMVAFRLAEVDASAEQKSRITAIMKGAANDLTPLRAQARELRAKSKEMLTAATIDRAQLENLRVQGSQLRETISRRMLQAMADAAEVLTPEQRAKVAQKMESRRQRRG